MPELTSEQSARVRAADGWLRLGNVQEADAELAHIPADQAEHPEVLQARWRAACLKENWADCERIARRLTELEPESRFGWLHLADTFFRMGRPQDAFTTLHGVLGRFEANPTFPYHLARYACAMQRFDEAALWVATAAELAEPGVLLGRARNDPALAPIHDRLGEPPA